MNQFLSFPVILLSGAHSTFFFTQLTSWNSIWFLLLTDYLGQQMNTQILMLNGVNNSDWLSHIYNISSSSPPVNELDCLNQCLNIQRTICDFFVYFDAICFLGNYENFKMLTSNPTFGCKKNVTVKVVKGKYQFIFSYLLKYTFL
jgi:hypothetical protein